MHRRTATLRGRELHLDRAEFDMLVFLAAHPKQLVTPQTMLATRWLQTGARQSQFMRVLISLRNKLEACGSAKHYLRTEPWIFYRFDPKAL
jgi:DNA-binding response OmpR family regulator